MRLSAHSAFRGTPQLPRKGEFPRSAERAIYPIWVNRRVPRNAHRGFLPHALALAITVIALAIAPATALAQSSEPKASLPDIEDEVMCPVCGTTLELASDSPQAIREREFILGLIAEGRTKEEIKDALVAEFGEEVLATPGDEGFDLVAWLVPGLAILAAGGAVFVGLRRWRRAGGGVAEGPAPAALDPEDAGRLERDLERYE